MLGTFTISPNQATRPEFDTTKITGNRQRNLLKFMFINHGEDWLTSRTGRLAIIGIAQLLRINSICITGVGSIMEFFADIFDKFFGIYFLSGMGKSSDKSGSFYLYLVTEFLFDRKI
jgi:hypothetical protein